MKENYERRRTIGPSKKGKTGRDNVAKMEIKDVRGHRK